MVNAIIKGACVSNLPAFTLDGAAVVWFFVSILVYRFVAEWGPLEGNSIAGVVQAQRQAWMRNMAMRENRVLDGVVLQSLSRATPSLPRPR